MNRRELIGALAGATLFRTPAAAQRPAYTQLPELTAHGELVIERPAPGKPYSLALTELAGIPPCPLLATSLPVGVVSTAVCSIVSPPRYLRLTNRFSL